MKERLEKLSSAAGIFVAVAVHAVALFLCSINGLKYIYPPPQEKAILIDFSQVETDVSHISGKSQMPQNEKANPKPKVELVQKGAGKSAPSKVESSPRTSGTPDGDVEVPQAPQEKPLDSRALFKGKKTAAKDTLSGQNSSQVAAQSTPGQQDGNARAGKATGKSSWQLEGRKIEGSLPSPTYTVQDDGVVVVKIWVNVYGAVEKAKAGAEGTTVWNPDLLNAAYKAALSTRFNRELTDEPLQEGTITYIFNLR